jgi:Outer membrane protein beta-barrel domain
MKHTLIFFAVAVLLFPSGIYAKSPVIGKVKKIVPKVTFGIKGGLNLQQISGTVVDNAFSAGYTGGVFVGLTKRKIGVQVEGLVKSAEVDYKPLYFYQGGVGPAKYHVNMVLLNVPVLFQFKLFWRVWGQIGPQFSTVLTAHESTNDSDAKGLFKKANFDGVFGLQAMLPAHFTLSARCILGLTNMNSSAAGLNGAVDTWNERSVQIALGFRFL